MGQALGAYTNRQMERSPTAVPTTSMETTTLINFLFATVYRSAALSMMNVMTIGYHAPEATMVTSSNALAVPFSA